MTEPLADIVDRTRAAHAELVRAMRKPSAMAAAFQWPWDIANAGAGHLGNHGSAVGALADGGGKVVNSPSGSSIVNALSGGPTDPANTDKVLNNGLFSDTLNSVRADRLLRTVFIGWSTGVQAGLMGGGGGSGVAYDILDTSDRAAVGFGTFNIGIGAQAGAGLLLGAMTAQPHNLNFSTCVWQFGASLAVSALVMVVMNSSDLSLVGFGLNLGGGAGLSSSVGYGSMSVA